jgi:hypothetical protein
MLEILIASVIAGKVEVAPNTFQYDIVNDNGQVIRVVETETNEITTH